MAPFPYMPMLAIMASLAGQQVVQMSVFAYAAFMVEDLGVVDDKDKAGYYSGLLCSGYMMGRFLSSHFWGMVSDCHGRLFVVVIGLVSTTVTSVAFGVSTTFAWAFAFRLLMGLFNAITVTCKTLVSEVCGTEHETVGMGALTMAWSLGAILGPGVGGILAQPALHHAKTFSEDGIFGRYPFLLPNLVGAGLALVALPLVLVFIEDTQTSQSGDQRLKTRCLGWYRWWDNDEKNEHRSRNINEVEADPASRKNEESSVQLEMVAVREPSWMQVNPTPGFDNQTGSGEISGRSLWGTTPEDLNKQGSLFAQEEIRTLLIIDVLFSFAFSGFDEVFTLWSLTTVGKGGLDWSTVQIGQVFLATGLVLLVFEMFAVPKLLPWMGVRLSQRLGSVVVASSYATMPLISVVNRAGYPVTVLAAIILFACFACSNAFYIGIALALNNATGMDRRGELNGISMAMGSLSRTVSPVVCSTLYAYSIDGDHPFPFDYHLAFFLLAFVRLVATWLGWNIINDIKRGDERVLVLRQ